MSDPTLDSCDDEPWNTVAPSTAPLTPPMSHRAETNVTSQPPRPENEPMTTNPFEAAKRAQRDLALDKERAAHLAAIAEADELAAHLPALRAELARRNLDHAREQARLPSPQPIDDTTPWEGVWLRSHAARADKPAPSGGRWCRGCGRTVVLTGVFCDLEVHGCLGRLRRIRAKTPPTRPDVT